MIYFAYGSNMSLPRLAARITGITRLGIGVLPGHDLRFHKPGSRDGSGKCDIFATGEPAHAVLGVVYRLDPGQKPVLDQYEGLGNGYEVKRVDIHVDGKIMRGFAYAATHKEPGLKPFHWYKEHVLRGARENSLPLEYIQKVEAVESVADADAGRHQRELAIYTLSSA